MEKSGKGYAISSTVVAVGMMTDLLVRAVHTTEIGPAVKCMTNIFNHASDTLKPL